MIALVVTVLVGLALAAACALVVGRPAPLTVDEVALLAHGQHQDREARR